jgi:DNA-directed RNA polymerase subunit RPC12/RpoP
MAEKGEKAKVRFYVSQKCPHCRKKFSAEIKLSAPASETPEQLINCADCNKQILVHCLTDPHNGAPLVCFIKYPVVIVP